MTQQFKFGDRVKFKELVFGYEIDAIYLDMYDQNLANIAATNKYTGKVEIIKFWLRKLQALPHPDTVRLDWLADRDQHIGNVQLPAECVTCNLHSLRDAIDMAMQMQPENAGTQEKDV